MIFDAVPFRDLYAGSGSKDRALRAFTDFIERKLGLKAIYDLRTFPYGRADLTEPLERAELLMRHGIIKEYGRATAFPDEPQIKSWYAICNNEISHQTGGTTWDSDEDALYAAVSEGLERYVWSTQHDYFVDPTIATVNDIKQKGRFIAPHDIAGFTDEQRALFPARILHPEAQYMWIQGLSLITNEAVYIPAQVVTGLPRHSGQWAPDEPVIRQQNTNGLATWPTREGAQLAGALEVIEREAYMVMWLNQLTLPKYSLSSISSRYPSLGKHFATCERYQLKTHVIKLPTDAPTHVVAVVLEDTNGNIPRFTIGIRSHRSLPTAIEKATTEALRSLRGYRQWINAGNSWDNTTPVEKIGHRDRLYYWSVPENARHLEFMVAGNEIDVETREWEHDTIEENLHRVIQWCKDNQFECISIPLTGSKKNPTDLHIEMVVMPQLLPTYLNEQAQEFGSARWNDVPRRLGYTPRSQPFATRPHPFS